MTISAAAGRPASKDMHAESFEGPAHLEAILREARGIVNDALGGAGA
jgi:hypothetical protein